MTDRVTRNVYRDPTVSKLNKLHKDILTYITLYIRYHRIIENSHDQLRFVNHSVCNSLHNSGNLAIEKFTLKRKKSVIKA